MTQTIEQLTARVRELDEDNARLKAECDDIKQVQFPRKLEAVVHYEKQLAAEQLNNKRLRDALQEYIDEHEGCQDADDWMAMVRILKGENEMVIVRIWKGKKEMVDSYYFSGQVWEIKRQLWVTVTDRFKTEDEARMALEKVKMKDVSLANGKKNK